jgi:hypothetical protein
VVVNNLNIKGVTVNPSKTKPKLVIHPDAVLPRSITS